jgi:hypothetical protein
MNTLRTPSEVIDAIGGTSAVASLTGRGMSAVSNWRRSGRIPPELFLVVSRSLFERGVAADPSVFGMGAPARVHVHEEVSQ